MIIHNAQVTGSLLLNGVALSTETGSLATTGSNNFSGSQIITGSITASAGFKGDGSGITNIPAAAINGLNLSQIATGSVTASVSLTGFNVNANTTVTGSVTATSFIGPLTGTASYASNANLLDGQDSSIFASTGSNTFTGTQNITNTTNASGFGTTAALYTDGGLRVTKDTYVSGTIYTNNLTVYGTQSISYISSSQLNVASNLITVNTLTPSVRFGGLAVIDSGSSPQTSGSFLFDSVDNEWIFVHQGSGGAVTSSTMITAGETYNDIGNETHLTTNRLTKATNGFHIVDSNITDNGTKVSINSNTDVTGSVTATSFIGPLSGTASYASTVDYNNLIKSASYAVTASYVSPNTFINSASFATTASYVSPNTYINSASFATTASYVSPNTFINSASFATTASYVSPNTFIFTSSFATTASYASTVEYNNLIRSASYAVTAAYVSPNTFINSASFATTASYASTVDYNNLIKSASYASNAGAANTATSATTATSASYATNAGSATSATSANSATSASYSTYAATAGSATSATSATTATSASYAVNAGTANTATSATTAGSATTATSASYATSAGTANSATSATSASYASTGNIGGMTGTISSTVLGNSTHYVGTTAIALNRGSGAQSLTGVNIDGSAATATSASYATNASTANSATTATSATSATSASYATNAGTANTATSATSATTATSASYATNAGTANSATTATSATNATNATYATSAGSATSATTATSASYATNAGTANSATSATSATTATSASYATSAGNSNTVTNGVYTNGSYSNPSWITSLAGSKVSGDISGNAAGLSGYGNQTIYTILSPSGNINGPVIKVRYDGATANRYIDIGSIDGNGVYSEGLKIYNGSSLTFNGNAILNAGNYNSYSPKLDGTGASGTWGISISGVASQVTVNYNNDSNSTYQLLWGSGNSVYGTAGVYVNPYTDYVTATSFNASDWFRSSGATGWYNGTYAVGIYATDSTWVRTYNNAQFYSPTIIQAGASVRGPIFYDADDTTYYLDPNGTSSGKFAGYLGLGSNGYTDYMSGTYGISIYHANNPAIGFSNQYRGTRYWLIYQAGSDTLRVWNSTNSETVYFYPTYTQFIGSARAPIFYDSDNTGYYLDPASTSVLNTVTPNLVTRLSSDTSAVTLYGITFRGYSANNLWVIGNDNTSTINLANSWDWDRQVGISYYSSGATSSGTLTIGQTQKNSSGWNHVYTYMYMNGANRFYWDWDGVFMAYGQSRAPIFYDYNDTGYYVDPASTSLLSYLRVANQFYVGTTSNININYDQIWRPDGGQIHIGYSAANNINLNNGGGYTYSLTSLRAPIFYDYNDTGYYLDPASTSNLNILSLVSYGYVGGQTTNGMSHFQWTPSNFYPPSSYTTKFLIRQDNSYTGLADAIPALTLFNGNGGNQTTVQLAFASPEGATNAGNSVALAGLIAKKEAAGNVGGWTAGSLTFYVKDYSTRRDALYIDTSGYVYSPYSFRAPIFYDSDDTGYYLNPASTSNTNSMKASEFRGNANVGGTGEATWHPAGAYIGGTMWQYGSMYKNNTDIYDISIGYANSSFRAPIFYDLNDTGYYIDPNSMSRVWGVAIRGDNSSTGTDNQIFFWGAGNSTTSAIGFKANGGYFTNPTGNGDGYNTYLTMDSDGRGWVFRRGVGGSDFGAAYTSGWILNNGIWQANASMRAPIFYDSNDTGYYVDPASESNLYRFTAAAMTRNAINYLSINSPFATRSAQSSAYLNGTMGWGTTDFNTVFANWGSGFIDTWSSPGNAPGGSSHYVGLQGCHYNGQNSSTVYGFQMACAGEADNRFFWRSSWPSIRSWVEMIHSGNIGSQSVSYASSAGSASSATTSTNAYYLYNNGIGGSGQTTEGRSAVFRTEGGTGGTRSYAPILHIASGDTMWQLQGMYYYQGNDIQYRAGYNNGNWQSWQTLLHSGNVTSYMDAPNKAGTSYYQVNTWMQLNGGYGLYCPSVNGAHWYPNTGQSSYTTWSIAGSRGGYGGIHDGYSSVQVSMFDGGGNGGTYREANGRWYWYYHLGNACMGINSSTTSSSYALYVSGAIYSTGNICAYSDVRKKENIETIDNALDKVNKMRGVYYNRIDDEAKKKQTGVIAQEINEILPEVVNYAADVDEYSVAYGNIVGVLIEAIKEQQTQINELKALLNK